MTTTVNGEPPSDDDLIVALRITAVTALAAVWSWSGSPAALRSAPAAAA